jgi:hypothetical protein
MLDVSLLTIEFLNIYMIQTTFKSLVYSFKLKLEFAVLSQIVRVIQCRTQSGSSGLALPVDFEQQHKAGKMMSSQVLEVKVMQRYVPPEWRLSREATAVISPVALTDERRTALEGARSSVVSMDATYPEMIGWSSERLLPTSP